MQPKTTIVKSKNEQSRRPLSTSTNADRRRQYTIARRSNTYPYCRSKINSENCYKCVQSNDCISVLNARFAKIENLVENLSKAVKEATLTQKTISPSSPVFGSVNLSKMNVDELLCFSTQLGVRLFGGLEKTKFEQKEKENNILSDRFQDVNPSFPAHKE